MVQAEELLGTAGDDSRLAWYVPGRVRSFLRRQITSKVAQSTLAAEDVYGRRVVTSNGIPVRKIDRLLTTEARIV